MQTGNNSQGISLFGSHRMAVGDVKKSTGDPDGLAVVNVLLLTVKAPGWTRHSPGTSLMSWAHKTGLETFERALGTTGACYSVIAGSAV